MSSQDNISSQNGFSKKQKITWTGQQSGKKASGFKELLQNGSNVGTDPNHWGQSSGSTG